MTRQKFDAAISVIWEKRKQYENLCHFPNWNAADLARMQLLEAIEQLIAPNGEQRDEKHEARIRQLANELAAELIDGS